ncbi:hypothetical protein [Candidatus Uabimicrobium sp. HlEnr_7]|uniref:hypothetical protein n=1 Tax=Candidatus Uabimicrobium helgolandensis TaxID=3095367 RepID=UPI00355772AD
MDLIIINEVPKGDTSVPLRWNGGSGNLKIELYKNGSFVRHMSSDRIANEKRHIIGEIGTDLIGTGTRYQIKITDSSGTIAWSERFRVK